MFENSLETFTSLAHLGGGVVLPGSLLGRPTGSVPRAASGYGLVDASHSAPVERRPAQVTASTPSR